MEVRVLSSAHMKKRVFIVHGWYGHPEEGWFPWLKKELETRGFEVMVPQLPGPDNPRIEPWVSKLSQVVGEADAETYFIGHSMGCQTIARYLVTLPQGVQVGGAVFVAGFFKDLSGIEEDDPEALEVEKHWLEASLDLGQVKTHLPRSVAIFSDDDRWVPLDNQDAFRDELGSEIVIEHGMGHFSGEEDGMTELPVVLETLLKIAGKVN